MWCGHCVNCGVLSIMAKWVGHHGWQSRLCATTCRRGRSPLRAHAGVPDVVQTPVAVFGGLAPCNPGPWPDPVHVHVAQPRAAWCARPTQGFERRRSIDQENFAEKENEYKHEIEKVIEEKEEAKQQARIMTHVSLIAGGGEGEEEEGCLRVYSTHTRCSCSTCSENPLGQPQLSGLCKESCNEPGGASSTATVSPSSFVQLNQCMVIEHAHTHSVLRLHVRTAMGHITPSREHETQKPNLTKLTTRRVLLCRALCGCAAPCSPCFAIGQASLELVKTARVPLGTGGAITMA